MRRSKTEAAPARREAPSASREILDAVLACLDDHKAENVVTIDLTGKSSIGDFMVIATGRSSRQVAALAEHVVTLLKKFGIVGIKPEGLRQGDWVLIDAGDIIIHLFRPEVREFYNLEKMWGAHFPEPERDAPGD